MVFKPEGSPGKDSPTSASQIHHFGDYWTHWEMGPTFAIFTSNVVAPGRPESREADFGG